MSPTCWETVNNTAGQNTCTAVKQGRGNYSFKASEQEKGLNQVKQVAVYKLGKDYAKPNPKGVKETTGLEHSQQISQVVSGKSLFW